MCIALIPGMVALLDTCPLKELDDFAILSSFVRLEMALNWINTEEISSGVEWLEGCIRLVDSLPDKVKTASVCVQIYNQLGIVWGNRNEQQKALEVLLKAKAVYESHIALSPPLTSTEWLEGKSKSQEKREKDFENFHTLTLFYLAQVYGNLGQSKISAQYCQNTLSRQLETQEYDSIEWSLNCVTLSQYYLGLEHFAQSRHCLAAASCVFDNYLRENSEGEIEINEELKEKVDSVRADLSRCWTKYAITLLTFSKKHQENESESSDPPRRKLFRFDTLEVADIESSVSADLVEGYDGAKPVFLLGQKHIEIAAKHYTLETFASENVKIVQDHSCLYKLLAFFESSSDLACRMHKRRYDMLTVLLNELNPQYFLSTCQQIMFELGDIESSRADLKIVMASDAPSAHALTKINKLIISSVEFYQQFLATFEDSSTRELSENIDSESLRPVLCAKLYIARLFSKLVCPDQEKQVIVFTILC